MKNSLKQPSAKEHRKLALDLAEAAELLIDCWIDADATRRPESPNAWLSKKGSIALSEIRYFLDPDHKLASGLSRIHSLKGYRWLEAQAGFTLIRNYFDKRIDKGEGDLFAQVWFYYAITASLSAYFHAKANPKRTKATSRAAYGAARSDAKKLLRDMRSGIEMVDAKDTESLKRLLDRFVRQVDAGLDSIPSDRKDKNLLERQLVQRLHRYLLSGFGGRYSKVVQEVAAIVGYRPDPRNITRAMELEEKRIKARKFICQHGGS